MTLRGGVVAVLLALGVLSTWLSALGVWRMRTVHDRLHYLGPASIVGALSFGLAFLIQEGLSAKGLEGFLAMALFAAVGPLVTHAVALAARTRTFEGFAIAPDEEAER
jgi:multisubunit Na+/H+ antiporter MnhG subunit